MDPHRRSCVWDLAENKGYIKLRITRADPRLEVHSKAVLATIQRGQWTGKATTTAAFGGIGIVCEPMLVADAFIDQIKGYLM